MVRCFIAIDLPEDVKAKIFHEFENLQKKGFIVGNFVNKSNLHVTLKFIGEISEEKIAEIRAILRGIKFKKFDARIGKIGAFPSNNYIRVLWVDFISEYANGLYEEINQKLGIKEKESFVSHITVARIKSIKDKKKINEELSRINFKKLDFSVGEFTLFKSELNPKGSVYKVIEKFKLQ